MISRYSGDVLAAEAQRRKAGIPLMAAELGLVAEDPSSDFVGAVVEVRRDVVVLADRAGNRRLFPWDAAAMSVENRLVRLVPPPPAPRIVAPRTTASGSIAVEGGRARVAIPSRILVEGRHDAELVEKVWGHDLRVEGVVVELLDGLDHLPAALAELHPDAQRRVGVLVDHLVPGSKESRLVAEVTSPHVLVTGHPFVDIWQAVKPAAVGIAAWPEVPYGLPWKEGVCAVLGEGSPAELWRRILASVASFADLEPALLGAVERLIDFVTEPLGG